jgi:hypothetical protein
MPGRTQNVKHFYQKTFWKPSVEVREEIYVP